MVRYDWLEEQLLLAIVFEVNIYIFLPLFLLLFTYEYTYNIYIWGMDFYLF